MAALIDVAAFPRTKICGITTIQDAELALTAGVDMLGLNFVPTSKRFVTVKRAREICDWVQSRIEVIAVVADLDVAQLEDLRQSTGAHALQLHGAEPPELLEQLAVGDFKAVRIATAADVVQARRFRGPRLLVDAKVGDALGGTGHTFDWSLLGDLVLARQVLLAGGLTPKNVAEAARSVRPWAVDVASGVEVEPPFKDPELVVEFLHAVRSE